MTALQCLGWLMLAAVVPACWVLQKYRHDLRSRPRATTPMRPGTHLGRHVARINATPTPTASDWADRLPGMEGSQE